MTTKSEKKTLNRTVKVMKITNVLHLNGCIKRTTLNIIINNATQGSPPPPLLGI